MINCLEDANKKNWWKGFAAGAAFSLAIFICICLIGKPAALTTWRSGGITPSQASQLVNKADQLLRSLQDHYLEELDTDTLLDGAYHGMVSAVGDPYTRYYTQEEYKEYKESTSGQYVGIGITVRQAEEGGAEIVSIEANGPAAAAGIQVGDILVEADGIALTDMEINDMVGVIRGQKGTEVEVTLLRGQQKKTVTVRRDTIEEVTVTSEMLETGVGYIALKGFEEVTTEQFRTALASLKEQNMQGLIIDLRDNPGGRVDVVQQVSDELLPSGVITYTEDKYGNQQFYSSLDEPYLNLPLVVLVNENSASAAEIMAGAIQDRGVGTLVGTTTYGKGIVQQTSPFSDGTAIKVTMAKYYTPNGSYIHKIGIEPDIRIELPDGMKFADLTSREEDRQLQTAVEALKTKLGR